MAYKKYKTNIPQYGFGSWLKKNAGTIGTVVGAGVGTLIAPGIGTSIGASIGGQVGGNVQKSDEQKTAQQLQEEQARMQLGQYQAAQSSQNTSALIPTFRNGGMMLYADGGNINIKPSKRGTFTTAAKKHGQGVQEFASTVMSNKENYSPAMVKKANFARNASQWRKANGGELQMSNTEPTVYTTGGTHEQNPNGGIPIGNKGLVEQGEVRYGDYIFSNRLS